MLDTPFEEISLTSEELQTLKSFSDGTPQYFETVPEKVSTLINYGLLFPVPEPAKYSFVNSKNLKITLRGTAYLKHLADKNQLLRLTEDSYSLNKKSYILNKIVVSATLIMLALTILALVSKH
jgi:hypothetical protein